MHCCRINARFSLLIRRSRRHFSTPAVNESQSIPQLHQENSSISQLNENESTDSRIKFPPILDLSWPAKSRRRREAWYNKVKKLGTVEEKIFELNMPRYYGWRVYKIEEGVLPYDPLSYAQYITRTHVVSEPCLPSYYDSVISPEALDSSVQQIRSQVEDALVFEYGCRVRDYQYSSVELEDEVLMDNVIAKAVSQQVNRILTVNLSPNYKHLVEAQLDIDPRVEAFWFFGGLEVPKEVISARLGAWIKKFKDHPINQCIYYKGTPMLHLRHNQPLKEIISLKDSENSDLEVPVETLDPRKMGYFKDRKRATVIPGFWPGDYGEFGLVSYNNRGHLMTRPPQFDDYLDAIKTQAIFGSFSWLYSQACYQGFSTFQDPTYPLINQMIITNGQWWSFSVYQLNATTMHVDAVNENPRRNICWITEPMKLFDSIEDGKVQGLNEDVLKHLIKFYANAPEIREGIEMKPYLGEEMVIAGIEDPERRKWIEDKYKYLMSNRSRHRLGPEIYHWQRIYMINHNTRPLDKKQDVWQFKSSYYRRRLDDHTPEYIPKCYREYPRSKKKWAKNYYPSVPEEDTITKE